MPAGGVFVTAFTFVYFVGREFKKRLNVARSMHALLEAFLRVVLSLLSWSTIVYFRNQWVENIRNVYDSLDLRHFVHNASQCSIE